MKLKTFFISYVLFLSILLAAIGIISFYLTHHQMTSLREQSQLEFERIAVAVTREVDIVYERNENQLVIDALLESHVNFYQNRNIIVSFETFNSESNGAILNFISDSEGHMIQIKDTFFTNPRSLDLTVVFDVTEAIDELREIQQILLYLFIIFSCISALILYLILNKIFKPLEIVTTSAQKIADGEYGERIQITGKHELALMATQFNQMAEEIEKRIYLLEEEAQRKQQFMDNLAHEIRTPLTSIYGYAEYMQKANLSEEDKFESTNYVMEEANHMKKITNSMLELATLRNYTIEKEAISIEQLFNQIATTLEISFKEYQVDLVIQPIEEIVMGQADLLRSLILNLCINGVKACADTHGKVILSAQKLENQIMISVTDNGCGMEVEEIEKITEPFYQVDKVRNRANGGIGLGLTLVKEIAQLHDARLIIESEFGIGATMKVIFTLS